MEVSAGEIYSRSLVKHREIILFLSFGELKGLNKTLMKILR